MYINVQEFVLSIHQRQEHSGVESFIIVILGSSIGGWALDCNMLAVQGTDCVVEIPFVGEKGSYLFLLSWRCGAA